MLSPLAPAVSIRTLGAYQITCDRGPVPTTAWQSTKAPELLKILIAHRRPILRQRLITMLWPETDPAVAGNQLSALLSTVHEVLHPQQSAGPLASDGTEVWLDRTQITLDVEEFLTRATAALHAHRTNQHDATALLQAAAAAHTGAFLQDDPSQDWAIPLADDVKTTYLALLQALATHQR
jgi:DNA-binding SARP family transcriptional activator